MATAGVVSTTILTIYKSGVAYGCATDVTVTINNEVREILCKDTGGWKEFKGGILSWSMSISGFHAFDATLGGDEIFTDLVAGTEITLRYSTEVTGDTYYEGACLFTNEDFSSSGVGQNAGYSATAQGSGALTAGVVA